MCIRYCVVLLFLGIALQKAVNAQKNVLCYYGTWATYRWSYGKFDVGHIKPELCSHLVYTFAGINNEGSVVSLDPYLDLPDNWGRNNFGLFNALKEQSPNLKTLLAVGGWNEGSAKYSIMAANPTFRRNFITSALKMIQDHGFDGLDLDWEYPNRRDTVHGQADVDNYTTLLREIREEFDKHNLLLTAAVASVRESASLSYDIPAISRYLDLVNIMTYDMYGAWDSVTGHNSPLHLGEGDNEADKQDLYTVDVALEFWLNSGCPPEKIILGVPFYGRTFTLRDASVNTVRAPAVGAGIAGPYTATNGYLGYNEFCVILQTESWVRHYDSLAKVPYATSGRNWVSYDDANSIIEKVKYGLKYNISGIMMWSIETDDFHGLCGDGDFPLLRAINSALDRSVTATSIAPSSSTSSSSTSSTSSSTSTTEISASSSSESSSTSTTESSSSSTTPKDHCVVTTKATETSNQMVCGTNTFEPNPSDCNSYYMCIRDGTGKLIPRLFQCPASLHWDRINQTCNFPLLANCNTA